jgi:hypothetical protein
MRFFILFMVSFALGQVQFTSSDLPVVVINTNGQPIPLDNPRLVADMGIISNGPGQRNAVTDDYNNYQGKISIEIRGSSTAGWLKKSYAIETQNEDGSNRNVSLLDLPVENDWILYAPYYDHSLIRNVLIYALSRQMGRYASRTRFCELVLNQEYQGVYVLMEKIKQDNDRVDIESLNPDENSGEDVTGGYIIKIDKPGDDYFSSAYEPYRGADLQQIIQYQYHYPEDNIITTEQKSYIRNYINNFEDEIAKARYNGVQSNYQDYIDLDSFVDHFILNEISKNVDGFRLSAFFYKDKNSKLHAGPIWDFNFSFGNVGYYNAWDTESWQLDDFLNYALGDRWLAPFWWYVLKQDSAFIFALSTRWRALRTDVLNPDHVESFIDALADTLAEARERNFEIWYGPGEPRPRNERGWFPPASPIMYVESYEDELTFIKEWYRARIRWMDSVIPNPPGYRFNMDSSQPSAFVLYGNYPNPFNNKTVIEFYLPEDGVLRMDIYNILGQPIATLTNKEYYTGMHFISWDGSDEQNRRVASGVYIAQVQYKNKQYTHKLVYIK